MRNILKIFVFIISIQGFSQTGGIQGNVIFKLDSIGLPRANVIISGTRIGAQTEDDGTFELTKLQEGKYDLVVESIGYGKDTIRNVDVKKNSITKITLGLPAGVCHKKPKSRKCPVDGKTKNVVPILYGLADGKMRRKMDKGKAKLGGCEVTGCEPNWFCKIHDKEF